MSNHIIHCPSIEGVEIDNRGLGAVFMECMKANQDKIAQIDADTGNYQTYSEFLTKSIRVAQHMKSRGITQKDVILICDYNTMDSYLPFVGSLFLGVPVSALDPSLSSQDCTHLLKITQPKMIFCATNCVDTIEQVLNHTNMMSEIVVFGQKDGYTPFSEFIKSTGTENDFECDPIDVHETAVIFFSSGTTGLPKGVCNTHYGLLSQWQFFKNWTFSNENGKEDLVIFLYFTTLYWISAVMLLTMTVLSGTTRLLTKTFEEQKTLKIIEKYKVKFMFVSPYYMHCFLKYPNVHSHNTSSLKTVFVGGGVSTDEQLLTLRKVFASATITNGYGMTETGGITAFNPLTHQDFLLKKPSSVGLPIPGLTYKLVDPETEEIIGPNQHGEIRVKSDRFMKGYYNNPEATAEAWDEEGYLRTGDIGYYDEDQCFYIVDRMKEMFKYKSWHITPVELEAILLTHPDVKQAAVIGLPDEVDGELPMGVVVLKTDASATKADILDFFNDQVPDRKKMRGGIRFVESLPYTPTGKLKRRQLKQTFLK